MIVETASRYGADSLQRVVSPRLRTPHRKKAAPEDGGSRVLLKVKINLSLLSIN
jgi:hypothetical protein